MSGSHPTPFDELAQKLLTAIDNAVRIPQLKRLWSIEQIADYFGVAATTVYRCIVCKPDFPAPIKITGGPQRWPAGEVIEWAKNQRQPTRRRATA